MLTRTFYKAVLPDGRDPFFKSLQWVPPAGHEGEWRVIITPDLDDMAREVATIPTAAPRGKWPLRLISVKGLEGYYPEDVDPVVAPYTVQAGAWRFVGELDPLEMLGPQGKSIGDFMRIAQHIPLECAQQLQLPEDEARRLKEAGTGAFDLARRYGRGPAWNLLHSSTAGPEESRLVMRETAVALLMRDLLEEECYDYLTRSWRKVMGTLTPTDHVPFLEG